MTVTELSRPEQGDVIELILADHRTFESLLRQLRDAACDRDQARRLLSALHVAHAEAEEQKVYPRLRRRDAVDEEQVEHGEHEHAEGHQALLAVLELDDLDGEPFDQAVEKLTEAISHHLAEEELTILNPAQDEVPADERATLGEAFCTERNRQIDAGCGAVEVVRQLVEEAEADDLIDDGS